MLNIMPERLQLARDEDSAAIASLRMAVARQLTAQFGRGVWSFATESEWSVRADIATSHVYLARHEGVLAASLRLSTRPPWLGAIDFFTAVRTPLYLTTMAVAPKMQRQGIGRGCLEAVKVIAAEWPVDALRLDAYDAPAGAGDFYRKAGFTECHRGDYNGTPLVYFEYLVPKVSFPNKGRTVLAPVRREAS